MGRSATLVRAIICWIFLTTGALAPAEVAPVGAVDTAISPFVDDTTDFVIALDVRQIDLAQIEQWLEDKAEAAGVEKEVVARRMEETKPSAGTRPAIAAFLAAGGRRVYLLGAARRWASCVVVFPLADGADGLAICRLARDGFGLPAGFVQVSEAPAKLEAVMIGKYVIAGSKAAVDAAKAVKPAPRADLMQSLAAGGNAAGRAAISAGVLQRLPGAATQPADGRIQWISLAVGTPPQPFLTTTIQISDAKSAESAGRSLGGLVQAAHLKTVDLSPIISALQPQVRGNRVIAKLDGHAFETAVLSFYLNGPIATTPHEKPGQ